MRILILNCDFDQNQETNGAELLRRYLTGFGISEIVSYNVFASHFPPEEELSYFSGIIITGSRASVYENLEWIRRLENTVRSVDNMGIPALGICFGFQIVAQSLGGNIRPSGSFEEGFLPIDLLPAGHDHFLFNGFSLTPVFYQSHGDIADRLPEASIILARNKHSIQAYTIRNFFCVQLHPEILPETAIKMAFRDGEKIDGILNSVDKGYHMPLRILSNFLEYCKRKETIQTAS